MQLNLATLDTLQSIQNARHEASVTNGWTADYVKEHAQQRDYFTSASTEAAAAKVKAWCARKDTPITGFRGLRGSPKQETWGEAIRDAFIAQAIDKFDMAAVMDWQNKNRTPDEQKLYDVLSYQDKAWDWIGMRGKTIAGIIIR